MPALLTLIVVLFVSLIVVRIATVALTLSGMSREEARFQARSAWTGTGFTTAESEKIVRHPLRRQIITLLMIARSVGTVTAATTLALSFINVEQDAQGWLRVALLFAALFALWLFARSSWIERVLSRVFAWALKRSGALGAGDTGAMLHLAGDYAVMEMKVTEGSILAAGSLADIDLPEEGVLVLGVTKPDGNYTGAPKGDLRLEAGDNVLLYGRSQVLAELARPIATSNASPAR